MVPALLLKLASLQPNSFERLIDVACTAAREVSKSIRKIRLPPIKPATKIGSGTLKWSRLSEQNFRGAKWSLCQS
jgi:hypothetical protein